MALSRKKSREVVFRMIFANDFNADFDEILALSCADLCDLPPQNDELKYIKNVFSTCKTHINDIDEIIKSTIKGFTFDRIFKTDLAAIRLGITEIKYTETVQTVIINEVVEIAKRYGTEKSGGFVNGILAKVEK
jgi:N utilization substance protein B